MRFECPSGINVREAAAAAALDDPRFVPVDVSEVSSLPARGVGAGASDRTGRSGRIRGGRHGIVVERGARRALLLPQVARRWAGTPSRCSRLSAARRACLRTRGGTSVTRLYVFESTCFGEEELAQRRRGTGLGVELQRHLPGRARRGRAPRSAASPLRNTPIRIGYFRFDSGFGANMRSSSIPPDTKRGGVPGGPNGYPNAAASPETSRPDLHHRIRRNDRGGMCGLGDHHDHQRRHRQCGRGRIVREPEPDRRHQRTRSRATHYSDRNSDGRSGDDGQQRRWRTTGPDGQRHQAVTPSVVEIETDAGSRFGRHLRLNGDIVTNAHVVGTSTHVHRDALQRPRLPGHARRHVRAGRHRRDQDQRNRPHAGHFGDSSAALGR